MSGGFYITYTVERSWFERLFSLPWRPGDTRRVIKEWVEEELLPDPSLGDLLDSRSVRASASAGSSGYRTWP